MHVVIRHCDTWIEGCSIVIGSYDRSLSRGKKLVTWELQLAKYSAHLLMIHLQRCKIVCYLISQQGVCYLGGKGCHLGHDTKVWILYMQHACHKGTLPPCPSDCWMVPLLEASITLYYLEIRKMVMNLHKLLLLLLLLSSSLLFLCLKIDDVMKNLLSLSSFYSTHGQLRNMWIWFQYDHFPQTLGLHHKGVKLMEQNGVHPHYIK